MNVAAAPGAGTSTSTGATCRDAACAIAHGDANSAATKALRRSRVLIDMAAVPVSVSDRGGDGVRIGVGGRRRLRRNAAVDGVGLRRTVAGLARRIGAD